MIGERTNVTGSARFAELIKQGDYDDGASRSRSTRCAAAPTSSTSTWTRACSTREQAMTTFLNLIATEPEIARVPIMVDSSKWSVIEAGLQVRAGQGDRQLDQPEGGRGATSSHKARLVRRYGAGVVVMAFDETGQADTVERKVAICQRAYALLTEQVGFDPPDIIFDPNILADRHRHRGAHELRARTSSRRRGIIKATLPGREDQRRRQQPVVLVPRQRRRCARRCTRRSSTTRSGPAWTWASSTPASSRSTRTSRRSCCEHVEDVLFNRRPDATERLVEFAGPGEGQGQEARDRPRAGARRPVEERLAHALVHGVVDFIEADVEEARQAVRAPARGHRRAADGRHEDRRRPVRRGQDVPARRS